MNSRLPRGAAAFFAFLTLAAAPATAQVDSIQTLVRDGDVLSNGWTVSSIGEHDVGDNGYWAAVARTTETPFNANDALIDAGGIIFAEGDTLPSGETISIIQGISIGPGGVLGVHYTVNDPSGGASVKSRVRLGGLPGVVVLREDDPVVASGLPAGVTIRQIYDLDIAAPYILVSVQLATTAGALRAALLRYEVTQTGVTTDLLALEGDMLPLIPGPLDIIYSDIAVAQDGSWVAPIGFLSGGTVEEAVLRNGVGRYVDGEPGILVNSTWNHLIYPDVSIASADSYAAGGRIQISTGADIGIVLDRFGRVIQEGEGVQPVGVTVQTFAYTDVASLFDGRAVFPVPLTDGRDALCIDGENIMLTGTLTDGGDMIDSIPFNFRSVISAAPTGRFMTCKVVLEGNNDALVYLDRDTGSTVPCISVPNSTGVVGKLDGIGSSELTANDLLLVAYDLPLNSFGYMGTSNTPGFGANPGGSAGNICLGGSIGRYGAQIASSGADGFILTTVDFTAIPQPTSTAMAVVGETWRFQLWHRDSSTSGMPTSNFTQALAVTLR